MPQAETWPELDDAILGLIRAFFGRRGERPPAGAKLIVNIIETRPDEIGFIFEAKQPEDENAAP